MAQLAQGLGFDLADAFAGDGEVLTDLFQGMVGFLADAEAHAQHLLLARRQGREDLGGLVGEIPLDHGFQRRNDSLVLDEVSQGGVLLLSDGGLQGDRLLCDFQHPAHLLQRKFHAFGDLLRSRLAPHLLNELATGADQLVDRLDHVHRNAYGAGLIGDGAGDRLPDPPGGVGGELVAALVFEFVDRLHQTDVPFLDQVEKLQPAVGVLLGDGDHEAQVGFDKLALGGLGLPLPFLHLLQRFQKFLGSKARLLLDSLELALSALEALFNGQQGVYGNTEFFGDLLGLLFVFAHAPKLALDLLVGDLHLLLAGADFAHPLLDLLGEFLETIDDLGELVILEADLAHQIRDLPLERLHFFFERALLLAGDLSREPLAQIRKGRVQFADLPHQFQNPKALLLLGLAPLFLLVVLGDFGNADEPLFEPVAQRDDFLEGDGGLHDDARHQRLSVFDALGDLDLALARQKGNLTHLSQIHAHRVACAPQDAGLEIGLLLLFLFLPFDPLLERAVLQSDLLLRIDDLDIHFAEHAHDIVELIGGDHVRGQQIVDFVVGEEPLLLAQINELLYFFHAGLFGHLFPSPLGFAKQGNPFESF